MISDKFFEQFGHDVADAYEHLYDLAYLRSQPLLKQLVPENSALSGKDRIWQFHHLLLATIGELDPGPQAPVFSREWRRHRLLTLRYIDGLPPQGVADQLAISRRHFYREHDAAIEALAALLWARRSVPSGQISTSPDASAATADRLQLIRLETAQLSQTDQQTDLAEVMHGVLTILAEKARQHDLRVVNDPESPHLRVRANARLLRQLLLAVIGHLLTIAHDGELRVWATGDAQQARLTLNAQLSAVLDEVSAPQGGVMSDFQELAALSSATFQPLYSDETLTGFRIGLDIHAGLPTVLVIDDNDDILELFQRYLQPRHCDVIAVRKSGELLPAARRLRPAAIILDLMIPDQDGWDLLQILQQQPETRTIPVIICSILRQKELALSLGATAFLEKPFSEEGLLTLLSAVMSPAVF